MTIPPDNQTADHGRDPCRRAGWISPAFWLLAIVIVGVAGDFPLNDDWSYQLTVRTLVEQGRFEPCGWTSMPLVTHALWGALFCLPFGVSAVALRVSTAVMALLCLLATRALLREVGADRRACVIGTLTLAVCPLFVAQSFTFMTDVPFAALSTTALWLFARSLRTGSRGVAMLATATMLAATLNRQVGLFVALGYAVALVHRDGRKPATLLRAVLPTLLAGAALIAVQKLLELYGVLPSEYLVKNRSVSDALNAPRRLLANVVESSFVSLAYLGMFVLPITLTHGGRAPRLARLAGIVCTVVMAAVLVWRGRMMPLGFNTLMTTGIGPDLLRDVSVDRIPNLEPLPRALWVVVTAVAVVGAGLLITRLSSLLPTLRRPAQGRVAPASNARVLLLAATAAGLVPVLIQQPLDRYLIPFVPCLAGALLAGQRLASEPALGQLPLRRALAVLLLVISGGFSIVGTHDWLERGRTRWQVLHWLESTRGATWRETDGGFEYQGLHGYDPEYVPSDGHSWWWVLDDRFVVAMGPMPGYREVRSVPVDNWLGGAQRIVVLEREP